MWKYILIIIVLISTILCIDKLYVDKIINIILVFNKHYINVRLFWRDESFFNTNIFNQIRSFSNSSSINEDNLLPLIIKRLIDASHMGQTSFILRGIVQVESPNSGSWSASFRCSSYCINAELNVEIIDPCNLDISLASRPAAKRLGCIPET